MISYSLNHVTVDGITLNIDMLCAFLRQYGAFNEHVRMTLEEEFEFLVQKRQSVAMTVANISHIMNSSCHNGFSRYLTHVRNAQKGNHG